MADKPPASAAKEQAPKQEPPAEKKEAAPAMDQKALAAVAEQANTLAGSLPITSKVRGRYVALHKAAQAVLSLGE